MIHCNLGVCSKQFLPNSLYGMVLGLHRDDKIEAESGISEPLRPSDSFGT